MQYIIPDDNAIILFIIHTYFDVVISRAYSYFCVFGTGNYYYHHHHRIPKIHLYKYYESSNLDRLFVRYLSIEGQRCAFCHFWSFNYYNTNMLYLFFFLLNMENFIYMEVVLCKYLGLSTQIDGGLTSGLTNAFSKMLKKGLSLFL